MCNVFGMAFVYKWQNAIRDFIKEGFYQSPLIFAHPQLSFRIPLFCLHFHVQRSELKDR